MSRENNSEWPNSQLEAWGKESLLGTAMPWEGPLRAVCMHQGHQPPGDRERQRLLRGSEVEAVGARWPWPPGTGGPQCLYGYRGSLGLFLTLIKVSETLRDGLCPCEAPESC